MKYLILIAILLIYVTSRNQTKLPMDETTNQSEVGMVDGLEDTKTHEVNEKEPTGISEYDRNKGFASWYDRSVCGESEYGSTCKTANGEVFDETANTMACHSNYEFGTVFQLCRGTRCIDVVCNDRGGFEYKYPGRLFDLSRGVFSYLGELSLGTMEVEWKIME